MKAGSEAYRSLLGGGGWQGGSGEGGAKRMSETEPVPRACVLQKPRRQTMLYRTLQRLEASQLRSEVLFLFHVKHPWSSRSSLSK